MIGREAGGTITVKFGTVDRENGAGYIMPKAVMQRAIDERFRESRPVLGCLGTKEWNLQLKDVVFQVIRAWIDGDAIMGEIKLLGDPDVNSDRAMLEAMTLIEGYSVGFGTVSRYDRIVQNDYVLDRFDLYRPGEIPENNGA